MRDATPFEPGFSLRDASVLALARIEQDPPLRLPAWSDAEANALRDEASRQLSRRADAAAMMGPAAEHLARGITLVPFLEPGGAFGPAWAGHPFASRAMGVVHRMREPDLTRELAALMGPRAGIQGRRRAVTFLRLLMDLAGLTGIAETLSDQMRPTVIPEHPVVPPRKRAPIEAAARAATTRIDLLFEWPFGAGGQRAVVVVEAKLGATVADGQLRSYREEAARRTRGGPVALILLTATPDAAERRYRAWKAVRWFELLRRWEGLLAQVGDDDPEFARVRAHLWRHILKNTSKAPR